MAKLIDHFDEVVVKSIKKITEEEYEKWKWREEYIDLKGVLLIFESEKKWPGEKFVYFNSGSEHFKTSCGQCEIKENEIEIITKNSIYEFEVSEEEMEKRRHLKEIEEKKSGNATG